MSELRKSLDSIQALLDQSKSPSGIGFTRRSSSTNNSTNNNNNNDDVNQESSPQNQIFHHHSPSTQESSHPRPPSPIVSFTSPSLTTSNAPNSAFHSTYGNDTPATQLAPHHPNYRPTTTSSRSSSLCNNFTSPYGGNVRPFSDPVIGSPLSAFEEYKRDDSSSGGYKRDDSLSGEGGKKGRETSLLVSPLNTPATVRFATSPLNTVRTSLYGRDPTPFRSTASDGQPSGEFRSPGNESQGQESGESRSGMDPPAKSPKVTPHLNHHANKAETLKEEEELSIIRENPSYESKYELEVNASVASEVTGLTLPRTPVWRSTVGAGNTPLTNRSKASTHGSIGSHVVGSPSKLLSRFNEIFTSTTSKLDSLWDVIGISHDERSTALTSLMDAIETLCHEKISDDERVASLYREQIDEMRSEYESICKALGVNDVNGGSLKRDPSGKEMSMTLMCEWEVVHGRLEGVRDAVAVAKEDLVKSRERIVEAWRALHGDEGGLEEYTDVDRDLTEKRRQEWREKAAELEESVVSRTGAVVALTVDCQRLMRELVIDVEGGESVGHCEDDKKIMYGLQSVVQEDVQSPHDVRSRSRSSDRYTMVSLFETSTCMGISSSALDRLTRRFAELNAEKQRRRAKLAELGIEISALWTMLKVPEEEQKAFTDSCKSLGPDTFRKGEMELARLKDLKAVMLEKLIYDQRRKIEQLWELTNISEEEKASFGDYFNVQDNDKLTDNLLKVHERYVSMLQDKLEKMRPILDLIAKREAITAERFELDEMKKDPERLKGRHAYQQLKKEEKMDRRVKKELPLITKELEHKLHQWYEANKPSSLEDQETNPSLGHFLYKGTPYIETMHNQEHDWKMRKEREEQERHRKRDEERKAKQNSFGSTYAKLPGQKWKPSIGSTASSGSHGRSASNPRCGPPPRPLADVSGSRGNVPKRSRLRDDKPGRNKVPPFRSSSVPKQRM